MRDLPGDPIERVRLGRVLRAYREADPGLTQEQLASVAGVTKNYLADVERGARNPTYLVLGRILRALSVSWGEFGAALDRERRRASRPGSA